MKMHGEIVKFTTSQFDSPHLTKFLKLYVANVGFMVAGNGERLPDKRKDIMKL